MTLLCLTCKIYELYTQRPDHASLTLRFYLVFSLKLTLVTKIAISRNWQYKDVYRKMTNNQHHACIFEVNYRPQRSCGKVMFLHLSVILSTGGGGCVWQTPPRTDTPWQTLPGQTPPQGRHPRRDGYCSRWYGSYSNAFLLLAATKLGQGNIFTSVCQEFCPQGGRVSASVHAGIPPWDQAHPPRADTPPGTRHPPRADNPPSRDQPPPPKTRTSPPGADCSIRSTSGRYASYWNAFLLLFKCPQYAFQVNFMYWVKFFSHWSSFVTRI